MHSWYVFDRNYCGHATTIPVSINDPTARMPWQSGPSARNAPGPIAPLVRLPFLWRQLPPARPPQRLSRDIAVTDPR